MTKQILNYNTIKKEGYQADATIVWCIDARFSQALESFIKEKELKRYDLIQIPGAGRALAHDGSEQDVLLAQVCGSVKLHNPPKIYLTVHQDCGAYKMQESFNSDDHEYQRLQDDLRKAKEKVKAALSSSDISIETYLVGLDGIQEI